MGVRLAEIIKCAHATVVHEADIHITSMGLNSAEVAEGALFAAVPGTRVHGATYAASARASAVLTDEQGAQILAEAGETRPVVVVPDVRAAMGPVAALIYGYPSRDMVVIGITGTSGKTTTSYLVEAGLMAAGHKVGLIGTTGTRIDGTAVPTSLTTPEAPKLQELFARMRDAGVTHVVMEVSSHALALGRVAGTDFAVAGFTNLSQDHLDFHPTMQEYLDTKARLFDPASPLAAATAVVCIDDEWGQRMAERAGTAVTVATDGQQATVTATEVTVRADGSQDFVLSGLPGAAGPIPVHLPLPGRFNVANAGLAIALADAAGVNAERCAHGLAQVAVPGRMERVDAGQDFIAVVDYAHKPAAVAEVLDTLRSQVSGRVGIVVGAGGNRDHSKRPIMGRAAAQRADLVIITDDNPRDEDPAPIRQSLLEGAREAAANSGAQVQEEADRARAIAALIAWAQPGDAVVVAGKGHETGQLVKGVTHPFDDREEVRAALRARLEGKPGARD